MDVIGVGGCSASGAFYLFTSTVVPTLPKYTPQTALYLIYLTLPYLIFLNSRSQKKKKKKKKKEKKKNQAAKEDGGGFCRLMYSCIPPYSMYPCIHVFNVIFIHFSAFLAFVSIPPDLALLIFFSTSALRVAFTST